MKNDQIEKPFKVDLETSYTKILFLSKLEILNQIALQSILNCAPNSNVLIIQIYRPIDSIVVQ